jgi:hypothetical protein
VTVTAAVPLAEPEVAVIVAVPLATAVTNPADETVAIDELDVVHVTVAPDIVVPPASFTVAAKVTVSSMAAKVFVLGATVTFEATWVTVTELDPLAEPEVAVIVTDPVATEVTSPADETVATDELDVVHVAVESERTFPSESLTVALSVAVSPIDTKESEFGDTVTVNVSVPTVTEANPLAEPEVAMIEVDPVATAVTSPADETVATPVFVDDQVRVGLEITVPPASFTVAARVAVSPIDTKATEVGESVTLEAT